MTPPSLNRYVLGLDLALRNTGVVVYDRVSRHIVHTACIQTENKAEELDLYVAEDNARCVREICANLELVLIQYNIVKAYAELPHGGGKSSKAVASMCLATGGLVAYFWAQRPQIPLIHVTPYEVKQLVRMKGAVDKREVEKKVIQLFGSDFLDQYNKGQREHVADAAGALVAGIRKDKL